MVALLYINIKVEQRILNTRNISKSIVDNDCYVGIAVLKMINLFVCFSLKPDETTINRYVRFLGQSSRDRMTVYRSKPSVA
jgi:hypothetical protein